MMEERYHATIQNRFYPDMYNINKSTYIYIYINSTNNPPIMIINRIYENQNLFSL
jgi:hypothetical protein